jgi:hypothetical protein
MGLQLVRLERDPPRGQHSLDRRVSGRLLGLVHELQLRQHGLRHEHVRVRRLLQLPHGQLLRDLELHLAQARAAECLSALPPPRAWARHWCAERSRHTLSPRPPGLPHPARRRRVPRYRCRARELRRVRSWFQPGECYFWQGVSDSLMYRTRYCMLTCSCTALAGVHPHAVTCQQGTCVVKRCRPGWTLVDGGCVKA